MAPRLVNDEALDMLREILAELRGLRADLTGARRAAAAETLPPASKSALCRLVSAIPIPGDAAEMFFTVRELFEHAAMNSSEAIRLRAALAVVGDSHAVGRLLRQADGLDFDGRLVTDIKETGAGMLRSIAITRHGSPPPGLAAAENQRPMST